MGAEALGATVGFFRENPVWVQEFLVVLLQVFSVNPLWVLEHLVVLLLFF